MQEIVENTKWKGLGDTGTLTSSYTEKQCQWTCKAKI